MAARDKEDIRELGKERSQRIQIDYYRKPTWLTRSRWILALVALAAAGFYGFVVLASGGGRHVSTGPVAAAHAWFENDCGQCHRDFTPIAADARAFATLLSSEKNEQACRGCHRETANHFREAMHDDFASIDRHCSSCHRDHQGRARDLTAVSDRACTQCHSRLEETLADAAESDHAVRPRVTGFTAETHGDFASLLAGDEGRVEFNHALHMLPGQVLPDRRGGFTLQMLPPQFREQYRKRSDGAPQDDLSPVMLACNDCHSPAGTPDPTVSSDAEVGRHMGKISFDRHCAACHALTAPGQTDEALPIPHAAPWAEVETLLTAKIVGGREGGALRSPRQLQRSIATVGEGDVADASSAAVDDLPGAVAAARNLLQSQCIKCHRPEDVTDEATLAFHRGQREPLIPARRLRRGIFDHSAHRRMDCAYCHAEAYAGDAAGERKDSELLMIGGIETCVDCHRSVGSPIPQTLTGAEEMLGAQGTWASDACTTCHRYHWERMDGAAPQRYHAGDPATMSDLVGDLLRRERGAP